MIDYKSPVSVKVLQSDAAKGVWGRMVSEGIAVQAPIRKCDKYRGPNGKKYTQHKRYMIK